MIHTCVAVPCPAALLLQSLAALGQLVADVASSLTWVQVFETRTQWSRYALTQEEVVDPSQGGRFNTTEIHCTEFFPAVRWGAHCPVCTASWCT